jgi:plasmid stabilization system protein ParE
MNHYKIKFHPNADKEIEESFDWYLAQSKLAALNFIEMVDKKIEEIRQNPKRYAVKIDRLRETKIAIYPYSIIYEFFEDRKTVYVHSVFHLKRNPKIKFKNRKVID